MRPLQRAPSSTRFTKRHFEAVLGLLAAEHSVIFAIYPPASSLFPENSIMNIFFKCLSFFIKNQPTKRRFMLQVLLLETSEYLQSKPRVLSKLSFTNTISISNSVANKALLPCFRPQSAKLSFPQSEHNEKYRTDRF